MYSDFKSVVKSLNDLIEYSTDFRYHKRENFKYLHQVLVTDFFKASSVVIDTEAQKIYLGLDMLAHGLEVNLTYKNFEKFLKSCVRHNPENLTFYKKVLEYYAPKQAVV